MKKIFLCLTIMFLCFVELGKTLRAENFKEYNYQDCINECNESNYQEDGSFTNKDCQYKCEEYREYYIPSSYKNKVKLKVNSKDSYSGCIDECVLYNQVIKNYVDNLPNIFDEKNISYQNPDIKIICERDVVCLECLNTCWDELKENSSITVDEIIRNHKITKKYIIE